ncbi:MAG: response regulator transcription factor [Chitinophagaceae bacterium]
MKKITILLVDDHRLLRESWYSILNSDTHFSVVGDTGDGVEAIRLAKNLRPDIVLMDINMTPVDGFEVTKQIHKNGPGSRVIGLTMYNNVLSAKRLLALGAMGYLTKNSSKEEMKEAILEVSSGKKYICEEIKNVLAQQELEEDSEASLVNSLSKREIEIVQYVKKGFSSREIALQLDIGMKTVEVHRYNILRKLHLKNSASLINFFNVNGI